MKTPRIHLLLLGAVVLAGSGACRKASAPEPEAKEAGHEAGEAHEETPGRVTLTAAAI